MCKERRGTDIHDFTQMLADSKICYRNKLSRNFSNLFHDDNSDLVSWYRGPDIDQLNDSTGKQGSAPLKRRVCALMPHRTKCIPKNPES